MNSHLLDTNAVIALMEDRTGPLAARLRRLPADAVAMSAIVLHELAYGAYGSGKIEQNLRNLSRLAFEVLDFTAADALCAGEIRARLRKAGTPIGPYDVLIGAQALARDLILVTANVREFARIEGLKVEDWPGH
ncbi:type II toxin-antitoxin system VapC family toxin [Prosthecomicrobium sp. N25]|uniref:type II toxin-antitoxin system VapC family toxin n=1 Tax=Prosthecomicrobium sp. N25 TaxID=3129254 RepID=UPI0030780510